ncbi:MAG: methionyl-tRNA formyltransferase, partial [Planctomycetes bacterium]|nr:methionyl-tRNA formyltransferase [Planctomycetota bacterium]
FLALYETDHQVAGLFTQPDRTGRGHHRHVNPLKNAALEHGTPIFQPPNVNEPDALSNLKSLNADLCVVAAYGQILSQELLSIPRLGAINIHASLLPKYRGAAPIQYAILNGEQETGITIFQIEPQLDAGLILGVEKTAIQPKETSGELEERLRDVAAGLTLRVIDQIDSGTVSHVPQDPAGVTRAPRIRKEQGAVNWSKSADEIGNHVRAMQPWPNPYTFLCQNDRSPLRLILLDVETVPDPCEAGFDVSESIEPGTVMCADGKQLVVQAGEDAIRILRLRPEGKRDMAAREFSQGHRVHPGDTLRSHPG